MSSCWKCGKELPEGQVECEYGCGEPARKLPTFGEAAAQRQLVPDHILVQVNLNLEAIAANPQKFETALVAFMTMLEQITMKSGLVEFAKPKPK